ncbi:hypothetical protein [Leptolyngbya sp. FACHB-261]|uniref:baeRF3 domain-containing protein n=1 Tax=Leptolyngbya sp. FACHB-261 TaxID=2692806 RepID=UPI001682B0A8|nr:hypothetical protein [Leptolyngbya sp. FACHB-261]MBD2100523.1 hypothetical protein [Leptolyngbya sp. FACHB-261]
MALLSRDELKTLIEQPEGLCVSLYMPTQKAGPETRQNPIRFKNLIREAEERLTATGMRHTEVLDLLKPAHDLDTGDFWQHQDQGLAMFIAPSVLHYYQLPVELAELVVVNGRFHLKPLLPLFTQDEHFYILALSQNQFKFFKASPYDIQEIELEGVPKSMDEALNYDSTGKQLQNRISTSKGGTSNPFQHAGTFHGQGSPETDGVREDIVQFFRQIDHSLYEQIKDEKAPLVLAGVEYLLPLYQDANNYPHLIEEGIKGNPEDVKPEELRDQVWAIVEPLFQQVQQQAIERYQELSATEQTSTKLEDIIPAAYYQRIDSLFVAVGQQQWGEFDPETYTVQLHREAEPNDEDLLDFAAIHTLLNGGTVYAVEPGQVPDKAPVAAVFRY